MSLPLESYCSSEIPLVNTDDEMRSSARSKSPFRRRKNRRNAASEMMEQSEVEYQERKRSFFEDPGLFETSAIEVVLEVTPEKTQKEPHVTPQKDPPVTPRKDFPTQVEEQRTPETTASSCSDQTPPEINREDLKRKTFKQKFMQKKIDPPSPKDTNTNRTTCTSSTKETSRDGNDDQRNPLETSRRCFPFSVHATLSDKPRGRSLSRGRNAKSTDLGKDAGTAGKATTPLRRRARSMSRRSATAAPTTKTAASSKVSSAACLLKKNRSNASKTPLMEPNTRASTEDEEAVLGDESPDPKIEARLSMRPRLLARLQDHEPPQAPPVSPPKKWSQIQREQSTFSMTTPRSITLARQKSMFSEISTPSEIEGEHSPQHPVVQRMEQSLLEATRNGKKIDRMLVYQTLFQIADSLESPEEQAAMQRELALLLQNQEPSPTAIPPVPQDTFSPQLSENLGPAFSPPRPMASRTGSFSPPRPMASRTGSRFSKASGIPKGLSRANSTANAKKSDEFSDDGFTEWGDDLDSQSTGSSSRASTDDTMNFISDMFNFSSYFSRNSEEGKDMRDDEDVGEDEEEDDEIQVPESWNNFQPPPNMVRSKSGTRFSRRRSRQSRRKSQNTVETEATRPGLRVQTPCKGGSPDRDRRAWWRKKNCENHTETPSRCDRERSTLPEDDALSLSSIDSQQYGAVTTWRPFHGSPGRVSGVGHGGRGQRSKSTDGRRTMLM